MFVCYLLISILGYVSISVNLKKIHNLGSDRISVLESASYPISVCGSNAPAVEALAISLNDHKFGVTVAHFPCNKQCPTGLIHCRACPSTNYSLDATQFTDVHTGDDVYVFCFPTNTCVRNDRAIIGNEHGNFYDSSAFNNEAIIRPKLPLACANDRTSVSVIVPWHNIYQCIEENLRDGNITFPSDCSSNITQSN